VISMMPYSDQWWWWPGGSPQGHRPVLFFPPAGADQTIVRPLVHHLAGTRLGALRMPGRGLRRSEPAPARMEPVIDEIATSIATMTGPAPVLVGHSFGGLLAFAVAQELDRRGTPPARLVAVASTAPHAWEDRLAEIGGVDEDDYVERRTRQLMADGAVPKELADHPELGAATREALATDVRMSYRAFITTPLSCPITAITARDDDLVDREASALWHKATNAAIDELTVPGGHFFYREHPLLLARLLLGELTQLDGAYHGD